MASRHPLRMFRPFLAAALATLCVAAGAQQAGPRRVRRAPVHAHHGGGRLHTNVHQGPDTLHAPWAGSGTYEKNLGTRSRDAGRSDFQRDRDATLDVLHREEDRARAIARQEAAREETRQAIRENKAVIEANARAAEAERRAREAERSAEIRARAAEQERELLRRRAEQEQVHDAVLSALPDCAATLPDGRPCRAKANPGYHFCAHHLPR